MYYEYEALLPCCMLPRSSKTIPNFYHICSSVHRTNIHRNPRYYNISVIWKLTYHHLMLLVNVSWVQCYFRESCVFAWIRIFSRRLKMKVGHIHILWPTFGAGSHLTVVDECNWSRKCCKSIAAYESTDWFPRDVFVTGARVKERKRLYL